MLKKSLLLLCLCAVSRAQDPIGVLEGQVEDPAGASVGNATVTLENAQNGRKLSLHTPPQGIFHFSNLPVGEYSMTVEAPGFATYSLSSIRIDIGRLIRVPVKLSLAGGRTEVDVQAAAASIDLGVTLGNVVSSREAEGSSAAARPME